jgi:hypothetical protein
MAMWNDYNDAKQNPNLIPKGTLAKVRLSIRPGGFDDPTQGWTGGYATRGNTGAVYLNGEFTVLEGQYAKRKIWSLIGLYSPKGPDWANIGRSLIRGMLNSARGLSDKDVSPQGQAARRINGFADLDGIEFVARIDVSSDTNGDDKKEVRGAVIPGDAGNLAANRAPAATSNATRFNGAVSWRGSVAPARYVACQKSPPLPRPRQLHPDP